MYAAKAGTPTQCKKGRIHATCWMPGETESSLLLHPTWVDLLLVASIYGHQPHHATRGPYFLPCGPDLQPLVHSIGAHPWSAGATCRSWKVWRSRAKKVSKKSCCRTFSGYDGHHNAVPKGGRIDIMGSNSSGPLACTAPSQCQPPSKAATAPNSCHMAAHMASLVAVAGNHDTRFNCQMVKSSACVAPP